MKRVILGLLLFLGIYALATVLFWPPLPVYRLVLLPLVAFMIWKKEGFDRILKACSESGTVRGIFLSLLVFLIIIRASIIGVRLWNPPRFMEDIAHVYIHVIQHLFNEGPGYLYTLPVDPYSVSLTRGEIVFNGFKYPPLQLLTYAPTVLLFGSKGIYGFHVLVYGALGVLIFLWLRRYSLFHASLGAILFLMADHVAVLAFNNGTNDLLPTLLVWGGVLLLRTQRSVAAGVSVGLSLLAKQLPAGLFLLPLLIQGEVQAVLLSLLIFGVGILPFLLFEFKPFIENVFLFHWMRPIRETSMLISWSPWVAVVAECIGWLAFPALSLAGTKVYPRSFKQWSMANSFLLPTVGLLLFLVFAKMSPVHYFLWVTPFFILWMVEPRTYVSEGHI